MSRRSSALVVALVLAFAAGIGLRVLLLTSSLGVSDSDEGVWVLMARHVLEGEFPVYYWGQGYGGTIEVYLAAPVVWAFGGGLPAARALALLLSVAVTCLVWVVGRRALDPRRATVAAALFWVWPAYGIWKATRVHGFYLTGQILVLLVVFLVLRLAERPRRQDAVFFGLVVGLAAWETLQVIPVLVPALAWLAWRRPGAYRLAWLAVPGLVLGSLPALVVNVMNHWWFQWLAPGGGTFPLRLRAFFTAALPQELGLRVPFSLEWLVPMPLGLVAVGAAVVGTGFLLFRHRPDPIGLLAAVALGFPFVYALSSYTWYVMEPRYLFLLAPVIALLVASQLTGLRAAVLVLAGAVCLSAIGLLAMNRGDSFERREGNLTMPADIDPIVRELEKRHITRAVSEYWLMYRVTLATKERIILNNSQDSRYLPYRRAVAAAGPSVPHVYVVGSPAERRARAELERNGYTRETFGGFSLWTRP